MSGSLCPNCRLTSLVDGSCPECGAVTKPDAEPPARDDEGKREIPAWVRYQLNECRQATKRASERKTPTDPKNVRRESPTREATP